MAGPAGDAVGAAGDPLSGVAGPVANTAVTPNVSSMLITTARAVILFPFMIAVTRSSIALLLKWLTRGVRPDLASAISMRARA